MEIKPKKEFDVLMCLDKLSNAIEKVMNTKAMPNWKRYSQGKIVIEDLTRLGAKIYLANKKTYRGEVLKLATEASDLWDEIKYEIRRLLNGTKISANVIKEIHELSVMFGSFLGGWLKCIKNPPRA